MYFCFQLLLEHMLDLSCRNSRKCVFSSSRFSVRHRKDIRKCVILTDLFKMHNTFFQPILWRTFVFLQCLRIGVG